MTSGVPSAFIEVMNWRNRRKEVFLLPSIRAIYDALAAGRTHSNKGEPTASLTR